MSSKENSPVICDDDIYAIGERYGLSLNPDDATQYKLCQVILLLESKLSAKEESVLS